MLLPTDAEQQANAAGISRGSERGTPARESKIVSVCSQEESVLIPAAERKKKTKRQ